MTVSRWKVMAGVLGVSLGGLAAAASQCPKPSATHTARRAEDPPADPPKVPPGGSGPAKPSALPDLPPVPGDALPPLPAIPGGSAPKAPDAPAAKPTPAKPDSLPPLPAADPGKKPEVVPSGAALPAVPPPPSVGEPTKPTPPIPAAPDVKGPPVAPSSPATPPAPPAITSPEPDPFKPSVPRNTGPAVPPAPPSAGIAPPATIETAPPVVDAVPLKPALAPLTTPAVPAQTKFRILLRVGEGEPSFEVRHGDDLVMKVACEKVDIKSPEKGGGLSAVKASGKVRFVGFGAEGTCDEFSFLAGTGEVFMTGNVKVQVKDKIGRVESELTTDKMHYKVDATALPGAMKP